MATATKIRSTSKPSSSKGEYGVERSHDLPWNDKKVALFKALKALGATSEATAKGTAEIAAKSGLTNTYVRHYGYHAKAAKLIAVTEREGVAGKCFYLTKTGAAIDPVKALKEQKGSK